MLVSNNLDMVVLAGGQSSSAEIQKQVQISPVFKSCLLQLIVKLIQVRVMFLLRHISRRVSVNSYIDIAFSFTRLLSAGLSEIIKNCTYVGMADDVLALAQCKTRLYLLNVFNLR